MEILKLGLSQCNNFKRMMINWENLSFLILGSNQLTIKYKKAISSIFHQIKQIGVLNILWFKIQIFSSNISNIVTHFSSDWSIKPLFVHILLSALVVFIAMWFKVFSNCNFQHFLLPAPDNVLVWPQHATRHTCSCLYDGSSKLPF